MASLRDKLNAYAPVKKARETPAIKTDCYRAFGDTPADDYGLPPVILGLDLAALTGETMADTPLSGVLFLDTETTGLSGGAGTLAFLIGLGYFENGRFIVEQVLMRDYDEEVFALSRVSELLQRAALLVTFNGHTFDMPLLESRFTMQRMRQSYRLPPHLDLLRVARSVWRLRLRRCSLSALEEKVFQMHRPDDLPGALVPKAFFDYLSCRDFALLAPVLRHNAQDIRTLPLLMQKLLALYQNPLASPYAEDVYSIGRVMEKRGGYSLAHRCYRAADIGSLSRLTRLTLADSLRRQKLPREAANVYEKMIADGQAGAFPYIALAKLCEHQLKCPERALSLTRRAMLLMNPYDEKALADAQKRALRLIKKCGKG